MFQNLSFHLLGIFSFLFQSQRKAHHDHVFLQEKRLLCLWSPALSCEVPAWVVPPRSPQDGGSGLGGGSPGAGVIWLFVDFLVWGVGLGICILSGTLVILILRVLEKHCNSLRSPKDMSHPPRAFGLCTPGAGCGRVSVCTCVHVCGGLPGPPLVPVHVWGECMSRGHQFNVHLGTVWLFSPYS